MRARYAAVLFLFMACTQKHAQLPLGGDRQCSWSPDIAVQCCYQHDNDYWVGGTEQDRAIADLDLYRCMLLWGVPDPVASTYYFSVRKFGASSWNYSKHRTRGLPK